MTTLGARVRELRQSRGLSQQALSGDGLSTGYISLIESGKRTPSRDVVERLAAKLGVTPVDLTGPGTHDESVDRLRLDLNFGKLALANSDPAEAVRTLSSVPLDEVDGQLAAEAALTLAQALEQTGELDEAVGVLETLVQRSRRDESWLTFAEAATVLSVMYIESGDVDRAVDTSERALGAVEEAGLSGTDEHLRLSSAFMSALIERGDLLYATRRAQQLMRVADRDGSTRARGSVYWNAAVAAQARGRLSEAVRLTDRAVALMGEQESSRDLPRLRMNYAWLLLLLPTPRPDDALEQLDLASSDPSLLGASLDLASVSMMRGRAMLLLGAVDEAAACAADALQTLGPSENVDRVSSLLLLGDIGTAQLDLDLASEALGEAHRILSRLRSSRTVAGLWRDLGDSWRSLGEQERASECFDTALQTLGLVPRPTADRVVTSSRLSSFIAQR